MSDLKFGDPERPEQVEDSKYSEAGAAVYKLANSLIEERHIHLRQAKILFLFFDDQIKWRGKEVVGRVYKVHDREKVKVKADLEVVISRPVWEQLAEENKQEAAMDWLLCFITLGTEAFTYTTEEPNFYGFYKNIDGYGMWDRGLKTLEKAISQEKLPGM